MARRSGAAEERPDFGDPAYWARRYEREKADRGVEYAFDWYCRYSGLSSLIEAYMSNTFCERVLVVGCGNSRLSEDMFAQGYTNVTSIDVAAPVIVQMNQRCRALEGLEFLAMDVRHMDAFADASFDLVVDKGTLDCLFASINSISDVELMLREVSRVLKPGAPFVCMSYGAVDTRLLHLDQRAFRWKVESTHVPESISHTVYVAVRYLPGEEPPEEEESEDELEVLALGMASLSEPAAAGGALEVRPGSGGGARPGSAVSGGSGRPGSALSAASSSGRPVTPSGVPPGRE